MKIFEVGIDDVLSYLHYPPGHRVRISSTNPLERLNLEIRRRTRVVWIFPHAGACLRLIGMLLVEKHEDWLTDEKAYLTFDDASTGPRGHSRHPHRSGVLAAAPACYSMRPGSETFEEVHLL
jgi:hypothetical protein